MKKIFLALFYIFLLILPILIYAEERPVKLQWDHSTDYTTIQSYRIYYYRTAGNYADLPSADYAIYYSLSDGQRRKVTDKVITIDKVNTTITIYLTSTQKVYYFSATSVNPDGTESETHSNEVSIAPSESIPPPVGPIIIE